MKDPCHTDSRPVCSLSKPFADSQPSGPGMAVPGVGIGMMGVGVGSRVGGAGVSVDTDVGGGISVGVELARGGAVGGGVSVDIVVGIIGAVGVSGGRTGVAVIGVIVHATRASRTKVRKNRHFFISVWRLSVRQSKKR